MKAVTQVVNDLTRLPKRTAIGGRVTRVTRVSRLSSHTRHFSHKLRPPVTCAHWPHAPGQCPAHLFIITTWRRKMGPKNCYFQVGLFFRIGTFPIDWAVSQNAKFFKVIWRVGTRQLNMATMAPRWDWLKARFSSNWSIRNVKECKLFFHEMNWSSTARKDNVLLNRCRHLKRRLDMKMILSSPFKHRWINLHNFPYKVHVKQCTK